MAFSGKKFFERYSENLNARCLCASTMSLIALSLSSVSADAANIERVAAAQTLWSVNRVASITAGSYCTIAQKYDNDSVVTLARNLKGEYSLAFDFSAPLLASGKSQVLKLQVGASKPENFSVKPQSQQVAVLPLGKDKAFIETLQKSMTLSITAGEKTYKYHTKKFKEGHDNLLNCVTALNVPTKPADVDKLAEGLGGPKGTTPISDKQIESATKEINAEGLLAAKPMPSSQLVAANKMESTEIIADKVSAIEPAATVGSDANNIGVKSSAVNETVQKDQRDGVSLNSVSSIKSANSESVSVSSKAEVAGIEANKKLQDLRKENQELKEQLIESSHKQQKLQASLLDDADKEVTERDLKNKSQIRELNLQIAQLKAEKQTLEANFNNIQKDSEAKQLKQTGGNWDLEQATKRYQESQREIRRLGARIEEEQLKCVNEKKQVEAMLFDPEITQTAQISKLNGLKDQLQEKESTISELQKQIAKFDESMSEAKSATQESSLMRIKLAEVEKKLNAAVDARNKADMDFSVLKQTQDKTLADTSLRITELQKDLDNGNLRLQTIQEQLKNAETKLAHQESENTGLTKKLSQLQSDVEKKDAELAEIKVKADETEGLKSQLASARADIAKHITERGEQVNKISSLEQEISKREADLTNLNSKADKVGALQTQLIAAQTDIAKSNIERAEQADRISSLMKDVEQKQADLAILKSKADKIDGLQAQLILSQNNIAKQDIKQKEQTDRISSLEKEVSKKESAIAMLQNNLEKADQLQSQLVEAQETISRHDSAKNIEDLKISELQKEVDRKNDELKQTQDKLSSLEIESAATLKAERLEASNIKGSQASLEKQISTLNADLTTRTTQLREAEEKLSNLVLQNHEYQNNVTTLQSQLSQAQKLATTNADRVAQIQPSYGAEAALSGGKERLGEIVSVHNDIEPIVAAQLPPASVIYPSVADYKKMIKDAGFVVTSDVQEISIETAGHTQNYKGYQWQSQNLYGNAEIRPLDNEAGFDSAVKSYLDRVKANCKGDFALSKSETLVPAVVRSQSYDIACVGNNGSSSAAVIFVYNNGLFSTVSQEGTAEMMAVAMDARDKLAKAIR